MRINKTVFINYCLPIIGVIFLAGLAYAGWTPPPTGSVPPADNIEPPISSGSATAYKAGALGIGGLFESDAETHLALLAGKVGIGTSNPIEKLQIAGKALADDFCLNGDPTKCLSTVGVGAAPGGVSGGTGDCVCYQEATNPDPASACHIKMYMNCGSGWSLVSDYASIPKTYCSGWGQSGYYRCDSNYDHMSTSAGSATSISSTGSQLFSSAGSFTVPAGVTAVTVELWGGGGGGGGGGGAVGHLAQKEEFVGPNIGGGGGGGGSGGHQKATASVTSGSNYAVTVGAGGSGGAGGGSISSWTSSTDYVCGNNGSSGSNGGASSVAGLVAVSGGSGGQGGHPACRDKNGIGGFNAYGGSNGTAGENGSNGAVGNRWEGGGAGGFSVFGQGGSGRSGGIGANNFEMPNGGTTGAPGDRGNDGFVVISW